MPRRLGIGCLLIAMFVCCDTRFAIAEVGFQQLYAFPTSAPGPWHPATRLVEGANGNFYGTTAKGGMNDLGTVFKVTPDGSLTVLVSFNGANGLNPRGGMILGRDGNFYGTTSGNSFPNFGTIFKMVPGGALTTIFNFQSTNGNSPYGRLLQGTNGVLYGTTFTGAQPIWAQPSASLQMAFSQLSSLSSVLTAVIPTPGWLRAPTALFMAQQNTVAAISWAI